MRSTRTRQCCAPNRKFVRAAIHAVLEAQMFTGESGAKIFDRRCSMAEFESTLGDTYIKRSTTPPSFSIKLTDATPLPDPRLPTHAHRKCIEGMSGGVSHANADPGGTVMPPLELWISRML